jgi:hypothetical protein
VLLLLLVVAVHAGLQLMQELDSLSASQQQQQQQPAREEPFNMVIARTFLASPQRTQTLRRITNASVHELAGDNRAGRADCALPQLLQAYM